MNKLCGIIPAVVTPFDPDEEFSAGALERLLERLYGSEVHGIYVCGQTGEGLLQPVAQRKLVAEVAVKCSPPGKNVIIHVGCHRTADAVELARHASRIGADAISSLPPAGGYSFGELQTYYRAVAASSDVPLLLYYFPAFCSSVTSIEQILELCAIPNVIGMKFTDFNLFKLSTLKKHGLTIFSGYDEVLVAGLLMGADGGIGTFYNLVPELFLKVYELARAGQWECARQTQSAINDLIRITLDFPVFPAVKTILRWSGLDCGDCLAPRRALSAAEETRLAALLAASDYSEHWLALLPARQAKVP